MVALSTTASYYNTPQGLHALCFSQGAVRERAGRGGAGRGARFRARILRRTQHLLAACPAPYFSGLTKSHVNPCSRSGVGTQVPKASQKTSEEMMGLVGRGGARGGRGTR